MSELEVRLGRIQSASDLRWTVDEHLVDIELTEGGRRQRVYFEEGPGSLELWSVVAQAAKVTVSPTYWRDLARRIWRKNALAELVAFAFDEQDRLIGFIEHAGGVLADEDLKLYVESVARECDQFEYLLSGEDRE